jgi:mono/diheme cytochrome c family protein
MTGPTSDSAPGPPPAIRPAAALVVAGGLVVLLVGGAVAFALLRKPLPPAPAEVAADPLLSEGRTIYLDRCVSCHGPTGKGDGPVARGLGQPGGDLTRPSWKHGDRPDQALAVVAEGVPRTNMAAWGRTLGPDGMRAVTAYVYYLVGRKVPAELRVSSGPQ